MRASVQPNGNVGGYWVDSVPAAVSTRSERPLLRCNPRDFLRVHRSAIVNVHRIRQIQPWFHGYHLTVLENGRELRMSRYQRDVVERLGLAPISRPG